MTELTDERLTEMEARSLNRNKSEEFIAYARGDISALIAEVKRLRGHLSWYKHQWKAKNSYIECLRAQLSRYRTVVEAAQRYAATGYYGSAELDAALADLEKDDG